MIIYTRNLYLDIVTKSLMIKAWLKIYMKMAENTGDIQKFINVLGVWCNNNCLKVNLSKSKVMHFRNPSVDRSNYQFILNGEVFDYVSSYQYLGLVLNEFLDYQLMANPCHLLLHHWEYISRLSCKISWLGSELLKCRRTLWCHKLQSHNLWLTKLLDKNTIYHLEQEMFNKYKTDWCTRMDSYGQGSKLRTYKLFKFPYCTEQYLLQNIPIRYLGTCLKFKNTCVIC
jgi:hypothetical protein